LTFAPRAARGKVARMMWKLRLLWYRADKGALAFGVFFSLIVGALIFALNVVFWDREAQAARQQEFHARSLDCLARNVYYEARGEPSAGQYAVAEVTMNRKASRH
jgi:N-acetylmuramoyl-L-alanine amidase